MSIEIQIKDDIYLASDNHQWMIQQKILDKKDPDKYRWKRLSFHPTPLRALEWHIHQVIRYSEGKDLDSAIEYAEKVTYELIEKLTPYFEIKVVPRPDGTPWTV